jgi:hypothetical protein
MELSASPKGAILSAAMAPGDEAASSVAIVNTGALAGRFSLRVTATGALARGLRRCGGFVEALV